MSEQAVTDIWQMDELTEEFDKDIWEQYKTYDPEKSWNNSRQPASNYRGPKRIVVDFVRIIPKDEHLKELDPRPTPWVATLCTEDQLTPKNLKNFEDIKKVSKVAEILELDGQRMLYHTYEKAYEGVRELSQQVLLKCVMQGQSILHPRTAQCGRCGLEVIQEKGAWTDFTKDGHAILVKEKPLEVKDILIHACEN